MKRLSIILLGLGLATSSYAQKFKAIEVDFPSLVFARSSDAGIGILLPFEARYNMKDRMSIGLQFQLSFLANNDPKYTGYSLFGPGNRSIVFDLYLTSDVFRPFIGFGTGVYSYGFYDYNYPLDGEGFYTLGVAPRLGFEFKHLRMMAEYNSIFGTYDFKLGSESYNPSYLAVKIALTIGGGLKD